MKIKTLLLCGLLGAAATGPAAAEDISYADAHGNLIVESDAGYKRIVGQARNAPTLANYLAPNEEPYLEAGDRVFADSQGNVTIRAAAGYKRILVGRGDEARDIARQVRAEQAAAYEAGMDAYRPVADRRHPAVCAGEGSVIKGRSYMYGLDKGETPVIVSCE